MTRWEGPIALLNTVTEDRRVLTYNPPVQRTERVPVLVLQSHRIQPVGELDTISVRGRVVWGEGRIGSCFLVQRLEEFGRVPCGVDVSSLLYSDVRCNHGVLRIFEWTLMAVTLYLGYEQPAFGNATFIRLKES
jgi:hypothetical protein